MWRSWIRSALLVVSAILAVSLVYLVATRVESVPHSVSPGSLGQADAGIDEFMFLQSRSGSLQWRVQAQHARVSEADHQAVLEQVEVTLYGTNGWELRLKGDEGTIDTSKKDFVLVRRDGPIIVELQNGYTIYTNHLAWIDEQQEIRTGDPVILTGHGMEVKGRGLIGKLNTQEFRVLEDVQVEIAR